MDTPAINLLNTSKHHALLSSSQSPPACVVEFAQNLSNKKRRPAVDVEGHGRHGDSRATGACAEVAGLDSCAVWNGAVIDGRCC